MASRVKVKIRTDADPRDAAEMKACQCRLTATLKGKNICPCGRGQLPPVPDDFELSDETWVAELQPFGLSVVIIGNLEKACIYTVGELRAWLRSVLRVEQIDGRKRDKIEKALQAAEGYAPRQKNVS